LGGLGRAALGAIQGRAPALELLLLLVDLRLERGDTLTGVLVDLVDLLPDRGGCGLEVLDRVADRLQGSVAAITTTLLTNRPLRRLDRLDTRGPYPAGSMG